MPESAVPEDLPGRASGRGGASPGRLATVGLLAVGVAALFAFNVHRHWILTDDAFISFRYAANLAAGEGLVWNPGERVEGYTNFLWVLLLALGLKLGAPPEILSNVLGVVSGAGVLAALTWLAARRLGVSNPWILGAPLLLALHRSFTAWCSGGLETQLFSLLVLLAFVLHLRERERAAPLPVGSALLFAFATLTRPDGLLFAGLTGAFFAVDAARRRRSWSSFLAWGIPYAAIVGAHFLWRHAYYGYWWPNTFYAKVPGPRFDLGREYLGLFHADYGIGWFLPLLLVPLLVRRRFEDGLALAYVVAYTGYLLVIGGDVFEFRFLVFVLPYAAWLLAESLRLVAASTAGAGRPRPGRAAAGAIAVALLATTHLASVRPDMGRTRGGVQGLDVMRRDVEERIRQGKILRSFIEEGILPRDVVFCVAAAGAIPYYTGWTTVDFMGLNDVHVAHAPLERRGPLAHEKRATPEYLEERGVEIFDIDGHLLRRTPRANFPKRYAKWRERWRNLRVGEWWLGFVTFLPDEEFERRFGHLERY